MWNLTLLEVLVILFIHWIADFVLQTEEQAKGKSKSWKWLLTHTITYTFIWFLAAFIYEHGNNFSSQFNNLQIKKVVLFTLITFVLHTATDYFTSRLNSKLLAKEDHHNFFVSIGFDQILHYVQLFLTFILLR